MKDMARLRKSKKGEYILPSGERISQKEMTRFRNLVARANRNRQYLIEQLPAQKKGVYNLLGRESDFISGKKSSRLYKKQNGRTIARFASKREFRAYELSVERLTKRDYKYYYTNIYRENYIQALEKTFGSNADEIIEFVESLSSEEWRQIALDDMLSNIGYVYYEKEDADAKLQQLKADINRLRGLSNAPTKAGGRNVKIDV